MKHLKLFESFNDLMFRKPSKSEIIDFRNGIETGDEASDALKWSIGYADADNCVGAYLNETLVGLCYYKRTERCTKIDLIFTSPRNQKIGKDLIDHIAELDETGVITANPFTDESEAFFLKCGFIKDEGFDPDDSNTVVMSKV